MHSERPHRSSPRPIRTPEPEAEHTSGAARRARLTARRRNPQAFSLAGLHRERISRRRRGGTQQRDSVIRGQSSLGSSASGSSASGSSALGSSALGSSALGSSALGSSARRLFPCVVSGSGLLPVSERFREIYGQFREIYGHFCEVGEQFRAMQAHLHGTPSFSDESQVTRLGPGALQPHHTATVETAPVWPAPPCAVLSGSEVAGTLVAAHFTHTLELGIVLGRPADFLLSLVSDATGLIRRRLELAMPLNLEVMACVLQENSPVTAAIADSVRALAQRIGSSRIEGVGGAVLDELAGLLRPLENPSQLLNRALGLVGARALLAGVQEAVAQQDRAVHQVSQVTCHPAALRLDSRGWIKALARAGTPVHTLRTIAEAWQVVLPQILEDRDSYGYYERAEEIVSEDVVRCFAGRPAATVPLNTVWVLVRRYVELPLFALALDEGSAGRLSYAPVAPQKKGVVALLRQARTLADGAGLSWAVLMRLVRCRLIEPAFIRHLPAGAQSLETVSRPVQSSDLVALMADGQNQAGEAMETAALLGLGLKYASLQMPGGVAGCSAEQRTALCLWGDISRRTCFLETGHLVQLFCELGRRDLLRRLTGDADSYFLPAVPLTEVCPRSRQFIHLAGDIRRDPVAMLKFMARNNLAQHEGYCAPPGTALSVRLLNSLALDTSLLAAFEGFVREYRPVSPTPAGVMETSSSGLPCDYACPITLDYMTAPVPTLGQGEQVIYFEKAALLQALEMQPCHPVTKVHLSPDDVRGLDVDMAHLRRIHQWRQAHPELEQDAVAFVPPDVAEQG